MLGTGVYAYYNTLQFIDATRWVQHSHQVVESLDQTLLIIQTAESNVRGYIITGNSASLQDYEEARNQASAQVAEVRRLTGDNPLQQRNSDILQQNLDQKFAALDKILALRRDQGFDAAQAYANSGVGRSAMQAVRKTVGDMVGEENSLLELRNARSETAGRNAIFTFLLVTVLALIALSSFYYRLNRDLAARKRAEQALKASEERSRTLLASLPQRVFFKDNNLRLVLVNEQYAADFHMSPDELVGKSDHNLHPHDLADKYRVDDERVLSTVKAETIIEKNISDGVERFVEVVKAPVLDTSGRVQGVVGIFTDITQRRMAEEKLKQLSMRDGLTGLLNRHEMDRLIHSEIEMYLRYERPLSLIMLDVDHFKSVNDRHGHQVGDRVLQWVADIVQSSVRVGDHVIRYGGEEMAVLLPSTEAAAALEIAERIRKTVEAHHFKQADFVNGRLIDLPVTISLGVAGLSCQTPTAESLIGEADRGLYEAKLRGRNLTVMVALTKPLFAFAP